MINQIQELIDEEKENMTDVNYLKICKLTKKLYEQQSGFYDVSYLETYITKSHDDYRVEFKKYISEIRLPIEVYTKIKDKILTDGYSTICRHVINDSFDKLKIFNQELYVDSFCDECSEFNTGNIEIKQNVIIVKIKQVD
jgi:hypothetical protein